MVINGREVGETLVRRTSFESRQAWIALLLLVLLILIPLISLTQGAERSASAAFVFVFGATLVGALWGVRGGIVAALFASAIYNLFLSEPFFRFSLTSFDDFLPPLAFNASAVASALIAGRLRDRARAAENLNAQIEALLTLSQRLQGAKSLQELVDASRPYVRTIPAADLEIRPYAQKPALSSWSTSSLTQGVNEMVQMDKHEHFFSGGAAFTVGSRENSRGILVLADIQPDANRDTLDSFLTIFNIAFDRWTVSRELREADVIRRSEEFKTTLLSSVSHDLRTPLSVISASASSLQAYPDSLDEPTKADLLSTILDQCYRLDRLTTNLLNVGRIQAGVSTDAMPISDLIEVLGSALGRIRPQAMQHSIEKDFRIKGALVKAEAVFLEQIFINILENAVVHTPPGTQILIEADLVGDMVTVSVQDSGAGIAESDRARIFDRFAQVSPGEASGAGLGLSIARGFAEAMGGKVRSCDASPALGGACIEVSLPAAPSTILI